MTDQLRFNILSAPIAAIDRRALSQAWYSALRLAKPQAATVAEKIPNAPLSQLHAEKPEESVRARVPVTLPARANCGVASDVNRSGRDSVPLERRAARSQLARDIERVFLDRHSRAERSTFSIGTTARVHVVLQTRGNRAMLVAICPPRVRAIVTRALADARYALASRGITIEVDTKGGE